MTTRQQDRFDGFVSEFNDERPREALARKTPGRTLHALLESL